MNRAKFSFSSGGVDYMLWAWKGDYVNFGAGAELGIYVERFSKIICQLHTMMMKNAGGIGALTKKNLCI